MRLKSNIHFHTKDDYPNSIKYNFYQGIDYAASCGFEVIALTCHKLFAYSKEYADYTTSKNILLIPGIELSIGNKHIVVLNCDKEIEKIKTFDDLKKYKQNHPGTFILAPHPYFLDSTCLGKLLEKHIDLFDAIELSWFYSESFNLNKKAEKIASKYNLPFIATSDTHFLDFLNTNYAIIDAREKTIPAVLEAIKQKDFKNVASPKNFLDMLRKQGEFMIKENL